MLRIVMDTDVMVSAFVSPRGAARQLLLAVLDERLAMVASVPLFLEYEAVLTRPSMLVRIGSDEESVLQVLNDLVDLTVPVGLSFQWRPIAADPDDDMVLEAAINGKAGIVASFNIKDMHAGAEQFGIQVLRPADVLRRLLS
jgi:putative PIN family toxin of toxin-antitoxin system